MKILCILQNAWGDRALPTTFYPNPFNKSAKVVKKMLGDCEFQFSNTTDVVTPTANGKPKPNYEHFQKVMKEIPKFDMILVCGNQAKDTVNVFIDKIYEYGKPILFVPHPAARNLTNKRCEEILKEITELKRKHELKVY